jgi:hypothetical protein
MRNILLLLLVLITFELSAQTATYSMGKGTMMTVETDYTVTNTTVTYFVFSASKDYPTSQDYQVLLTKGTGSQTDMSVQLSGRKFSGDSWTTLGAAVTSGTIATTYLLTISQPTPVRYREFKVAFTGTGNGTTTISSQTMKLWLQ